MFIGYLGLSCAERSWPVWLAKIGNEPEPMNFAREAVTAASEGASLAEGTKRLGDLKASLDGRFMLGEEFFSAIYAGFACWAVAVDALEKRHEYPSLGDSEQQISPGCYPECFRAGNALTLRRSWRLVMPLAERGRSTYGWDALLGQSSGIPHDKEPGFGDSID